MYVCLSVCRFAEANAWSQVYGLLLLPVAIAFCVYSLYTYMRRADMIRKKLPGPCTYSASSYFSLLCVPTSNNSFLTNYFYALLLFYCYCR